MSSTGIPACGPGDDGEAASKSSGRFSASGSAAIKGHRQECLLERSPEFPDAWDYLRGFRKTDELPEPEDDRLRQVLKRHLIVAETGDGTMRMTIPLMRRWLRERA